MDDHNGDYERLQHTLTLISHHPDYPGKGKVVRECLVEIEQWQRFGRLNAQQGAVLTAILQTSTSKVETEASHTALLSGAERIGHA